MLFPGDTIICAAKFGRISPNRVCLKAALGCGHINANEPDVDFVLKQWQTKSAITSNRNHNRYSVMA